MELPDWVVDVARPRLSASSFLVLVAVFRHGQRDVGPDGGRRAKVKTTVDRLARMGGLSKRSCQDAVRELAAEGFLAIHESTREGSSRSYSARYVMPEGGAIFAPPPDSKTARGGAEFAPPPDSRTDTHDDDDVRDPVCLTDQTSSSRAPGGAEIATWLLEEGVTAPDEWVARYGEEPVFRALVAADLARDRGQPIRNPPGFMRTLLERKTPLPSEEEQLAAFERSQHRKAQIRSQAVKW